MPRLTRKTHGSGSFRWLASDHSIANNRTETANVAAFRAALPGKDYIPSGYPVALVDGLAVPYDPAGTGAVAVLAGHVFTDQSIAHGDGNIGVPVLDHGRVWTSEVPLAGFTAPTAANDKTTIIYL
ncbi:hypothetical protein [Kocuria sp. KH4]